MSDVLDLLRLDAHERWQRRVILINKGAFSEDSNDGEIDETDPPGDSLDGTDEENVEATRQRQFELLGAVASGPEALFNYMVTALGVDDPTLLQQSVPTLPGPLTPGEFRDLPTHAEWEISRHLQGQVRDGQPTVAAGAAATEAFWAASHAVWSLAGMFPGDPVAYFLEGSRAGDVEGRVRNFVRRTGGIERIRGKTSVLTDCPIARAYWRVRIAEEIAETIRSGEIAEDPSLDASNVHQLLHDNELWAQLAGLSVKRLTSLNAPRARTAVLLALVRDPTSPFDLPQKQRRAAYQGAMRAVGRVGHGFSVNNAPWDLLLEEAQSGISDAVAAVSKAQVADARDAGDTEDEDHRNI